MKGRARSRRALQHYTTTERAIGILACVGDELVRTRAIAERTGISQQLVFKIVSRLVRAGLLTSIRGTNGGVCLGRPVTEITIANVVEAVAPGRTSCIGLEHDPTFQKALAAYMRVLDGYTVADAIQATDEMAARRPKAKPAKTRESKSRPSHQRPAPGRSRPSV